MSGRKSYQVGRWMNPHMRRHFKREVRRMRRRERWDSGKRLRRFIRGYW